MRAVKTLITRFFGYEVFVPWSELIDTFLVLVSVSTE